MKKIIKSNILLILVHFLVIQSSFSQKIVAIKNKYNTENYINSQTITINSLLTFKNNKTQEISIENYREWEYLNFYSPDPFVSINDGFIKVHARTISKGKNYILIHCEDYKSSVSVIDTIFLPYVTGIKLNPKNS